MSTYRTLDFPSYVEISSFLRKNLQLSLNNDESEAVIVVAARHFMHKEISTRRFEIETEKLVKGLTENIQDETVIAKLAAKGFYLPEGKIDLNNDARARLLKKLRNSLSDGF